MTLAPTELARRSPDATAFRHDPLRLSLVIADLIAADGHGVSVRAGVGVRVVERAADLELFKEQFLNSAAEPRVSLDDVRARLIAPLRSSLGEFVSRHDAAACLKHRDTLATLLLDRANELGFGCGIEFVAPIEITVESDSLAYAAARARMDSDQHQKLQQSARLAEMLRDIPAHLLPPDQQASALAALLSAAPATQARLLVVAGPNLATLDVRTRKLDRIPTPADLGPLRSVRVLSFEDESIIAVGGQRGVALVGRPGTFSISVASERGFNAVAYHAPTGRLVATHGELGVVTWSIKSPAAIPETFAAPAQARNLISIDERMLFSADGQLCVFDGQAVRTTGPVGATVVSIVLLGDRVVVVRESGRVESLDRGTLAVTGSFDRPDRTHCAAAVTAGGLQLLALAHDGGTIDLVTLRGDPVGELRSPGGAPRILAIHGRHLLGTSPDRASLLVWDATTPGAPATPISILAPLGHRIADVISA